VTERHDTKQQEAKPRAKSSREPGRDGKVAGPGKGRFSGKEDRKRSPRSYEELVTCRWKAPRIVGAAVSSRGLWTSGLGGLRRLRGREALEARSESNRRRRQGCQRLGLASRHGEENAPKAIEEKRQSQGPPKRNFGVVNHRVLRTAPGRLPNERWPSGQGGNPRGTGARSRVMGSRSRSDASRAPRHGESQGEPWTRRLAGRKPSRL